MIREIDVQVLHHFHGSYCSPAKLLNPVSDRFEIDFGRKVLPAGDKE
jgi:hypothetical protein